SANTDDYCRFHVLGKTMVSSSRASGYLDINLGIFDLAAVEQVVAEISKFGFAQRQFQIDCAGAAMQPSKMPVESENAAVVNPSDLINTVTEVEASVLQCHSGVAKVRIFAIDPYNTVDR